MLRVVSLSPSATDFVVALGAASKLIAVDRDSSRRPGVEALPVVDLAGATHLGADLVLVGASDPEDGEVIARLRQQGTDVVEVTPNDFDEVFALCRGLGARLVGGVRAAAFEHQLGRELAALAAESRGLPRPRVAAVIGTDPLELAGAHSFETDLIELAGASSTTHDHEMPTGPVSAARLLSMTPDLVVVFTPRPLSEAERSAARRAIGETLAVEFFVLDREHFWIRHGGDAAARLRDRIGQGTR